jgi:outer membrane protein TolC
VRAAVGGSSRIPGYALAEQVDVGNQDLAAAEARLRGARASVRVARAALFPTVIDGVEISGIRQSANRAGGSNSSAAHANYLLPIDVAYEPDIWGRLGRNVELNIANAQASAADLETIRLNIHAELAGNYFALHGIDAQNNCWS